MQEASIGSNVKSLAVMHCKLTLFYNPSIKIKTLLSLVNIANEFYRALVHTIFPLLDMET